MLVLKGVAASPGVSIGPAVLLPGESFAVTRQYVEPGEVKAELQKIRTAMQKTLTELDACEQKVLSTLGAEYANLMSTHKLILQDPALKDSVSKKIRTEHLSAQAAIFLTLQELAASFDKIEDPFFKERRNDIFDVGKRLVNNLEGGKREFLASITKPSLLVAHNLYPSDTINLQENQIMGFCTDVGGKTSHTALLAQSLNIPAVVGLSTASKDVQSGDTLIIDGENGLLVINPDKYTLANYRKIQRELKKTEALLKTINHLPVITEDGHAIKLLVNYDPRTDNKENKRLITDGLGLLRTEFLYMNTPTPPTEEEQYQTYLSVAKRFDMRPVTIRLADLGADKLPDFPLDEFDQDENPFMGCRGIRLFLKNPELMHTQLRAILESARRVTPSDTSPGAEKRRQIQSWKDFDGLLFAAELGIYEDHYQRDRSGRTWYRNNVRRVICQGHPRYAAIMRRQFFIGHELPERREAYQSQNQPPSGGWEDFPPEGF